MNDGDDPFAPPDPYGPAPDPDLSFEIDERFKLEPKNEALPEAHQTHLSTPKLPRRPKKMPGSEAGLSYAEQQRGLRRQYWTLTRIPVLLLLGWFTLSHVALDATWVFIDGVNLLFHEAGHLLFRWGGDTVYFLGGTLGQLLWPLIFALYFLLKRRERFSATVCAWWFGENFVNIATYMHDAPVEELALVGGDTHDWNHLFTKWDMIRQARDVADIIRIVGVVLMLGTLAYLVLMTLRPTHDQLAEGFTA